MGGPQPGTDELGALLGAPLNLKLRAGDVELQPLTLRQFGQLLGVLPPALSQFFGTFEGLAAWARENHLLNDQNELVLSGRAVAPMIGQLIERAAALPQVFDGLISAMAIASARPPEWVAALALDDAISLAAGLWELNADFFVQRVWPSVTRMSKSPTSGLPSTAPSPRPNGSSPAGRASSSV